MADGWEVATVGGQTAAPPAAPPAAPSGGGGSWEVDTPSAPAQPTQQPTQPPSGPPTEDHLDSFLQRHKDLLDLPVTIMRNLTGQNLLAGAGAGAQETLAGADKLVRRLTGHQGEDVLTREAAKPTEGFEQAVGKAGEGVGEFFTGEELLSMLGRTGAAMTGVEKLKSAQQIAAVLAKHPYIAKALKVGLSAVKAGGVGAGQELVKSGGDTQRAEDAGILQGGATALFGAGGEALAGTSRYLAGLKPGVKTLEGVDVPYLRSQVNKMGQFIEGGDITDIAPKIAADQQAAAQQVIRNTASRAVGKVLDMINDSRQYFSKLSPEAAESVPQTTSPFRFELSPKLGEEAATPEAAAAREAQSAADQKTLDELGDKRAGGKLTPAEQQQWQLAWDREAGQMRTTPSLAQATRVHQDLNDLYMSPEFDAMSGKDQEDINAIRKRLSDQIGMHHASSRFDPINTDDLVANTHTFGHAAAQLESTVQPVIQAMDRASKGAIGAAQKGVEEAAAAIRNATSAEAFKDATKAFGDRQKDLSQLLNRYSSAVSGADYDAVNKALPYVQKFQSLHNVFEHMMNGVTFEEATDSGLSRVMTGSARNFQNWLNTPENAQLLDDTVGKDSRTNLKQLTLLMSKVQPQRHMAEAIKNISAILDKVPGGHVGGAGYLGVLLHGMGIPVSGAAALGAGAMGARFVLRQAATNPAVGKALTYAIDHGVGSETYAPIIASMIQQGFRDDGQAQPEQGSEQPQAAAEQQPKEAP
jgi:hypothetical protein